MCYGDTRNHCSRWRRVECASSEAACGKVVLLLAPRSSNALGRGRQAAEGCGCAQVGYNGAGAGAGVEDNIDVTTGSASLGGAGGSYLSLIHV